MAVVSLVFGIIGIATCWIPFLNVVSGILSGLGVIFGAVTIKNPEKRGKSITGLILSAIALIVVFAMYGAIAEELSYLY